MSLRREDGGDPGNSLSRNPVRHQSLRDHAADQRGAKTRLPQRDGKLLQHLGGNLEADPKNQRRKKRRSTFPRNRQKRSSEHSQLILPHNSIPISCQVLGQKKKQRILITSLPSPPPQCSHS